MQPINVSQTILWPLEVYSSKSSTRLVALIVAITGKDNSLLLARVEREEEKQNAKEKEHDVVQEWQIMLRTVASLQRLWVKFGQQVNDGKSLIELPVDYVRAVLYFDNCETRLIDTNHL